MIRLMFMVMTGLTATLLWNSEWLVPFKLLVVLVHEIWHGIIALFSGALLEQIHIDLSEGGETVVSQLHSGPLLWLTVSAGYLGSALTGGLLIRRGLATSYERISLLILAAILTYISHLFAVSGSLAFYVGLGWGLGLGLGSFASRLFARYALLLLGTLFVWYSLYDLLDFTWNAEQTDAGILAAHIAQKDWWWASSLSLEELSTYISLVWSIMVLGILAFFFYPVVSALCVPLTASPATGPAEPSVLKDIPPEVDEWLMSRDLQWDGEKVLPLPPEPEDNTQPQEENRSA